VEATAARNHLLRRRLDVQDALPSGHPLGVTVGDHPSATQRLAVGDDTVDHVRDRLEAAVRVPRRPLRLPGPVVDLAHLVEVDERVGVTRSTPAKARRTGSPSPSKPRGAVVIPVTGRGRAIAGSGTGTRGRTVMSSTVTAGMRLLQVLDFDAPRVGRYPRARAALSLLAFLRVNLCDPGRDSRMRS
jgi:hypothetical protein